MKMAELLPESVTSHLKFKAEKQKEARPTYEENTCTVYLLFTFDS